MPMNYDMPPTEDVPADLLAVAEEADDFVGDELARMVPPFDKPINPKVMDQLAKAVADVGRVLGMDVTPDKYTEPVSELEPGVIRMLAMIEAAAKDYGKPLPISLDRLRTEADFTALTAGMMELAKDKGFEDFLDMPDAEEPDVAIAVEVDGPDGDMDMEEDFDFASRMRG